MKVILRATAAIAWAGAMTMLLPKTGASGTLPTATSEKSGATAVTTVERKDPPPDQKYQMRLLVWNFWSGQCAGLLDGPAGQAQSTDLIKGHDVDDAGNVYWAECGTPVIRCYRADSNRVFTVAGSTRGLADGPLARARFGGWAYNRTSLICVSGDGKHLFVRDAFGKGLWRYVDLTAGTVSSPGPLKLGKDKGYFIIGKDKSGEIYAFSTSGEDLPDCKGYKKLKVAPCFQKRSFAPDRYVLDVEKMRFYYHCRGPIMMLDLKTGEETFLTFSGGHDGGHTAPGARAKDTSGPLETTSFLCPTGIAISPGGRYLYVGQGDGSSCTRLDLEKKHTTILGPAGGGSFGWCDTEKYINMTGSSGWPAAVNFIPDGRGVWANCWGLYLLTPVKGGN